MNITSEHRGAIPADVEAPSVLDPDAWVDRYSDYLFRYAFSRLREANAAEEVVQETFLSGIRYYEQYSGRGTERSWLLGILKRKIIDFVRRRNKHAGVAPYENETDLTAQLFDETGNWKGGGIGMAAEPGKQVEMSELWGVVRGCLGTLPSGQADVFTLSVIEEMDSADICEELGISSSNFWVRMHRARLGLAACVDQKWEVEQR
jgi:RNA polymerase sigma-70 factor (ECF subfamily)